MGIIKNPKTKRTTTYTLKPNDIAKLIAADLQVPESEIEVEYVIQEVGGDLMDRYPGHNEVTKIRVTHNSKDTSQ